MRERKTSSFSVVEEYVLKVSKMFARCVYIVQL